MTTPTDKTASRVSDARLACFSDNPKHYNDELVQMAREIQYLRSLSSDSVSEASKGVRDSLWCESCGEAEQVRHTEFAGLCESCWNDAGQPE